MTGQPVTLGDISVTILFVNTRRELIDQLPQLVDNMPAGDAAMGRIVLIVPDTVRALLEWPSGRAPIPAIVDNMLVFRLAPGGLVASSPPFST